MKLSIGFSTCPNDTFIFDALVHHKIDTEGLEFDVFIEDVENLNTKAMNHDLDVTKISFATYLNIIDNYVLLDAGGALGKGVGPLLISKIKIYPDEVNELKIAIPGLHTTANLLLELAYPEARDKYVYLFSDIEEAVLSNEVDAGLIIHENRFTYEKKGLKKIIDLGKYWEEETKCPIPLGGIVVKRNLKNEIVQKMNRVLKKSVEFAMQNPGESYNFVSNHAREIEDDVIKKHIELYVNNYSLDLGKDGKRAIKTLFKKASELKLIPGEILIEEFFINMHSSTKRHD